MVSGSRPQCVDSATHTGRRGVGCQVRRGGGKRCRFAVSGKGCLVGDVRTESERQNPLDSWAGVLCLRYRKGINNNGNVARASGFVFGITTAIVPKVGLVL